MPRATQQNRLGSRELKDAAKEFLASRSPARPGHRGLHIPDGNGTRTGQRRGEDGKLGPIERVPVTGPFENSQASRDRITKAHDLAQRIPGQLRASKSVNAEIDMLEARYELTDEEVIAILQRAQEYDTDPIANAFLDFAEASGLDEIAAEVASAYGLEGPDDDEDDEDDDDFDDDFDDDEGFDPDDVREAQELIDRHGGNQHDLEILLDFVNEHDIDPADAFQQLIAHQDGGACAGSAQHEPGQEPAAATAGAPGADS